MPKVELKVRNLSGFDKSFKNLLSSKCGTLTPILVDELIPGSKVNLKQVISASLPPLASDTFMNVNLKVEAFFVPHRLCYAGFWDWISHQELMNYDSGDPEAVGCPVLSLFDEHSDYFGPGSLADYLGFRAGSAGSASVFHYLNIFPFLAYHRIYDDWYRHPLIQTPVFQRPMGSSVDTQELSVLPFVAVSGLMNFNLTNHFCDGTQLYELRQRNFGFDYFTTALPDPQLGASNSVSLSLPVSSGVANGSFTIAALRAANSMQQFAERNEMAGPREQDYIKAHYGVELSSGVAQRAILLGSAEIPVYSKGVSQMANAPSAAGAFNNNPFADYAAAQYGSAVCNGQVNLIDDFEVQETGTLMVLASLVPKVTYSSGIDRSLIRYTNINGQSDMADAILENVGMQPIFRGELTGSLSAMTSDNVFGYVDRYADWKHKNDELHGILRHGQSLDSFALQRYITGSPTIRSAFLEIPTSFLDNVLVSSEGVSEFGYWLDCFNSYKVAMPLSSYAIPSLQDPAYEHGKTTTVDLGGSRL